jgi:hypothetical protein
MMGSLLKIAYTVSFLEEEEEEKKKTHTHIWTAKCASPLLVCVPEHDVALRTASDSPRSQYVISNLIFRLLLKKQDSRRNFLHKHFDFFHYNIFAPFRTFKQTRSEHYTGNNIPKAAYDCSTAGLFNKVKMWAVRAYGTASTFN